MFADVTAEFPEFRVPFDEPFHVLDGLDVRWSVNLGFRLVHLDVGLEVRSEVSEREVMCLEKRVDSVTFYEHYEDICYAQASARCPPRVPVGYLERD